MMVHAIQQFAEAGFPISKYRYAGFGAFFFMDFIIFRRLLGISDMISMEHDERYRNRVIFNRPFSDIQVLFKSSSEYIPQLDRDKKHILWLDYDDPIFKDQVSDIEMAASLMSSGSLLVATIEVDFDKSDEIREFPPNERQGAWLLRFRRECGRFFDPTWTIESFAASLIARRGIEVLNAAILSGISMRKDTFFQPLFSFLYADGHEMLTFGGMLLSDSDKERLEYADWSSLPFLRRSADLEPFKIDVPILTRKERLYVDSYMPCPEEWTPTEFELEPEDVANYSKIFKYCPLYAELLL
jgi:hypothetical protein